MIKVRWDDLSIEECLLVRIIDDLHIVVQSGTHISHVPW